MTDDPALGAESATDSPQAPTPTQPTRRKPIRYNAATATPRLQRAAADPGPEAPPPDRSPSPVHDGTPDGSATGRDGSDDATTPTQAAAVEQTHLTENLSPDNDAFADAFRPAQESDDDGGGFSAEEYAALAAESAQEANDAEPAQSVREARYRVRLRAAENEIGRLQSLVEAMQRNEIQRLSEGRLADPGDLFVDFAVHDCLDDTDTVDPARVDIIIGKCLDAHPHWAIPRQPYAGPLHSGASAQAATGGSWRDAFAPKPNERG
ncbi:hypothetical protein [Mycolicibacterium sp. XJ775]